MNFRERQALDRYITGNYGEDQFKGEEEEMDDAVRFENGRCFVEYSANADPINLEAPLEAFGQCKLTSAFNELSRRQVLFVAGAVGLAVIDGMPYDELRWTCVSLLQFKWFEQIPGGVPKSVLSNHQERMTHYRSVLERVKRGEVMTGEQVAAGGTETTKKGRASREARESKPNVTYTYSLSSNPLSDRITKGVANEQTTNHDFIIVAILQGEKSPVTLEHLALQVYNTGRYVTKDPLPKSIRWHLLKMEKEGLVIAHEHPIPVTQSAAGSEAAEKSKPTKPASVVGTKSAKATGPAQATAKA